MEDKSLDTAKSGRKPDNAYGFSFAIAIGLVLFIAGLIITLTLGQGGSIGLFFGIPLLVAGLVLPLIMMRGGFGHHVLNEACPYCGAAIKTSEATIRLNCPACNRKIVVRDMKLGPGE
jgi:DNA-directed RNA polymerase subunit RPC12/RpoP